MEPNLVDKAKKAEVDHHGGQNNGPNQVHGALNAEPPEELTLVNVVLPVNEQYSRRVTHPNSGQMEQLGPSAGLHFTPEFSQEEQNYFQFLCQTWMSFSLQLWTTMSQSPECKQDMSAFGHMIRTGVDNFQRVSLDTDMRQELDLGASMQHVIKSQLLELLWTLAPEIDDEQKTGICRHFLENMNVLNIFHTQAAEHWTMEDIYSRLYGVNIRSPHIKQFLPADFDRLRLPNILKSSLFSSPWAESLELENFFVATALSLASVVSHPTWNLIFTTLLVQSASIDLGSGSNALFMEGHLKAVLFKTLLQITKSSNLTNQCFSKTLQLIKDVKKCSDILKKSSINKVGFNRIIEIDQIDVQQFP